jgi:hypothetical protein
VDPVPDPLLLRKSGSAGNRTRVLWICSQKLWPLDHRGGPINPVSNPKPCWELLIHMRVLYIKLCVHLFTSACLCRLFVRIIKGYVMVIFITSTFTSKKKKKEELRVTHLTFLLKMPDQSRQLSQWYTLMLGSCGEVSEPRLTSAFIPSSCQKCFPL